MKMNPSSSPSLQPQIHDKADSESVDIRTPIWFYLDPSGERQGPFSFTEMYLWWQAGFLSANLLVKTAWEQDFRPLGEVGQFEEVSADLAARIAREHAEMVAAAEQATAGLEDSNSANSSASSSSQSTPALDDEYKFTAGFNTRTGRFQMQDSNAYYQSKGLPADRDMRMMAHYFDYDAYAQQKSQAAASAANKKRKAKVCKLYCFYA